MKFDRRTADALYRVSFGAFAYAAYAELHPNKPLVLAYQVHLPSSSGNVAAA